jgi:hypothetical protein
MQENWRAIPGYNGRYEASDQGNIRSLPWEFTRVIRGRLQTFKSKLKLMKLRKAKDGYLQVDLVMPEGNKTTIQVHRLILMTFVGPPEEGQHACHYPDPDKTNNKPENLCWASRQENEAHKLEHGTHQRGENSPTAKLTDDDIRAIRASDETGTVLAKRYHVSDSLISKIRRGLKWAHVK